MKTILRRFGAISILLFVAGCTQLVVTSKFTFDANLSDSDRNEIINTIGSMAKTVSGSCEYRSLGTSKERFICVFHEYSVSFVSASVEKNGHFVVLISSMGWGPLIVPNAFLEKITSRDHMEFETWMIQVANRYHPVSMQRVYPSRKTSVDLTIK